MNFVDNVALKGTIMKSKTKSSLTFTFANMILDARLDKGLTQNEVAEAISVSTRWYQMLEAGEKLPGSLTLLRLIFFLELDIKKLEKELGLVIPVSSNLRRLFKSRR